MKDFIKGCVLNVIDENSIEIEVTQTGRANQGAYGGKERIHIVDIKPFLIFTQNDYRWKPFLEKALIGKEVSCLVNSRDDRGNIEAEIYLL
ncbi:MAG: hypothetical protein GTN70_09840 [Deltaproteobacteria bacterium]|nr:hypothetical protein [Deltaproteobacteria bacterium]NIS78078.1 hypothetical protein [Deltaproteobacteria bacterium]